MQELKCSEIIKAVNGVLLSGDLNTTISNICTDSRKIQKGDLFIPLIGEKFDGHEFVLSALDAGADACLTQKLMAPVYNKVVIKVEDTLKALGKIAAYYRQKFQIPVVAVTGSVGKTSTKEMIYSVLSQKFNVLKTKANYNNEIGLPMTLLELNSKHEAAVVEMGMRGLGEISYLTNIAKPTTAVITNIGMSHIERLGSQENILKAKLEILEGLQEGGLVVLNGDDELLSGLKGKLNQRVKYFGLGEDVDYRAFNVKSEGEEGTSFECKIGKEVYKARVRAPGIHNVYNALCAIAVGVEYGISAEAILRGICEFVPEQMRLNIINTKILKIINDVYNANPQSMEAALNVLCDIAGNQRKIAVLGDMLELGDWSQDAHLQIGKYAASKGVDKIITVGEKSLAIAKGAAEKGFSPSDIFSFGNNADAVSFLLNFVRKDDVILVKGSRGMKMEEIVNALMKI